MQTMSSDGNAVAMEDERVTSVPRHFAPSDYPHFSEDDWRILMRMARIIGPEATAGLLDRSSPDAQLAAVRGFALETQSSAERVVVTPSPPPQVIHVQPPSPVAGTRPLKVDVSWYSGHEKESLPRWFLQLDMAIRARQITDATQQVTFAISNLTGRAQSWALSKSLLDPRVFHSLESLKHHLLEAFQPPKSEFRTRQRFLAIRQGKRLLYDYVQEVRALIADIVENPIDEATQVSVFLNGLRSGPVRTQLFREYPETLESAITMALQEDFSHRQCDLPVQGRDNRPRPVAEGPTPMEIGNVHAAARRFPPNRQVKCFRCGRMGHMQKDCRAPSNVNARRGSPSARPQSGRAEQPKNGNRQ